MCLESLDLAVGICCLVNNVLLRRFF